MTRPQAKRTIYDDAVDAELRRWPGVTATRRARSKHYELVLRFEGQERFVVYPCSPSDSTRGQREHLTNVRAELREMGAKRQKQARSTRAKARVQKPAERPICITRAEPLLKDPSRDPWGPLASLTFPEPEIETPPVPRPWWRRVLAIFNIGEHHEPTA